MSKICTLGSTCSSRKGMCFHEKMMSGIVAVMFIAAMGFWLF